MRRFCRTRNFRGVRLYVREDSVTITANNPEQEEAEETLEVQYGGDDMEIGFNVNYLLDALGAVDEDYVQLGMSDANSSCLIHVVQPRRTRNSWSCPCGSSGSWRKPRCIRPTMHPARFAGRMFPIFSLLAPCRPGGSPVSVRRGAFTASRWPSMEEIPLHRADDAGFLPRTVSPAAWTAPSRRRRESSECRFIVYGSRISVA